MLQPILCPEIHGDSGLDGPEGRALLPSGSKLAQPGKAVLHMYSYIMEAFRQGYAPLSTWLTYISTVSALLICDWHKHLEVPCEWPQFTDSGGGGRIALTEHAFV